ncbi:MAG: hypothetical protein DRI32_02815 [Chloroflexi bacterium]|nr:MAG: hypothetical protein DRI32_02815 [Chloroflexota bacterium]
MFLLVVAGASAQVGERDDQTGPQPITSPKAALERALAYTGLEQTMDTSGIKAEQVAKLVIAKDSTTPFFSEMIDGQEVWCVTFPDVKLDLEGWYPSVIANQCPKTFEVLIEPTTGALLRVLAWCETGRSDMRLEPPADYAEESIRWSGDVYDDVVAKPPQVSLFEALGAAVLSSPVTAKELHAVCVLYTEGGRKDCPVWAITGRDVPIIELGGPFGNDPENRLKRPKRGRTRSLIDATDGSFIQAVSRPLLFPPDSTK